MYDQRDDLATLVEIAREGLPLDLKPEDYPQDKELLWEYGIYDLACRADSDEPEWLRLAGRLKMLLRRERVAQRRGFGANFLAAYQYNVERGFYSPDLLTHHYTEKEFRELERELVWERDLDYDYAGAHLLHKRYLSPDENLQEALMIIAMWLAVPEPRTQRLHWAKQFYNTISRQQISLATPMLMNLRRPGGQLSSCFIIAISDSLRSIAQGWCDAAFISQRAGGVGIDISRLRAKGAKVNQTPGAGGGVVPWVRIWNDIAVAVNQQGKRKGAITIALGVWHLDILEFIELRTEAGDPRRKAHDIFPQVVIPDSFMRAAEADETWLLHDPFEFYEQTGEELHYYNLDKAKALYQEGKLLLSKEVKARTILKTILRTQIETGLPYLFFVDTVNRANPNLKGHITAANLCVESYSVVKPEEYAHCCNLASLNLSRLLNHEDLVQAARLATRLLDNAIELTHTPIPAASTHNRRFRTIGVGVMGLADWLAWHSLSYGSEEAIEKIDELFEEIALCTYEESVRLAAERGTFADYQDSAYALAEPRLLGREREWFRTNSRQPKRWLNLFAAIQTHGLRNSQLMAIAPNSSTSLVQGCSPSVLPIYRRFYVNQGSNSVPIAPPFLRERFWYYKEYANLRLECVIQTIATIQKWVDTGISFEWLIDLNQPHVKAKYLYDCVMQAWKSGIKTIYYVRTIERREENTCESCAN